MAISLVDAPVWQMQAGKPEIFHAARQGGPRQICLPPSMTKEILHELSASPLGGGLCNLLEQFSDIQLLEELARRVKLREEEDAPDYFCNDCRHFKYANNGKAKCGKAHKMKFWVPRGYTDDFGYYVEFCPDRDSA